MRNKIWQKASALALAAVLTAGMLAACSANPPADSSSAPGGSAAPADKTASEARKPYQVEFWTISLQPTFTDFFNGLNKKYEDENPGITVKWVDLPIDAIQQKLITAVAGGTSPDVVNLNTQMALTLAGKNALVDLAKEATPEQTGIYAPSLYDSARIGDSVYAFPWYGSPQIMIYNKDLIAQAGIQLPTQFLTAFDDAKTMKEKTGAYLFMPEGFFFSLQHENIPILNADGTAAAFNTPATLNLLQSYKDMTTPDYLPKSNWGQWDNMLKLFETSKLAIINSTASSLSRIKDEAPDVYAKIGLAPTMTGASGKSQNALMNVAVPTASKNHAEAIRFANFVTNDESQLAFCKEVEIFPSTIKASADPYFTSDTDTLEGQARALTAQTSPNSMDYSRGGPSQGNIRSAVDKVYEACITGNGDIQKALDQAETTVNAILKQQS